MLGVLFPNDDYEYGVETDEGKTITYYSKPNMLKTIKALKSNPEYYDDMFDGYTEEKSFEIMLNNVIRSLGRSVIKNNNIKNRGLVEDYFDELDVIFDDTKYEPLIRKGDLSNSFKAIRNKKQYTEIMSFYYNINTPLGNLVDFDINKIIKSKEDATRDWFLSNIMPVSDNAEKAIDEIYDLNTSVLTNLSSGGGKKFKEYFGGFLKSNNKSDDPKEILSFIERIKSGEQPTIDDLKKYTFYKQDPDFSSNTLDKFYNESKPSNLSFYDFGDKKNILSFPLSKLNSLLDELDVELQNNNYLANQNFEDDVASGELDADEINKLRKIFNKNIESYENLIADILRLNKKTSTRNL